MHVIDMVFLWARTHPHRQAIVQPEIITSFKGLADAISSISNRIKGLNLDRSAPIAVSIANPVVLVSTLLALLRSGYSVAPVNPSIYPYLRGAGIRDLIYDTHGQVASGGRNIRIDGSWLPPHSEANDWGMTRRGSSTGHPDIGIVFFTSGTTGLPKKFFHCAASLDHKLTVQCSTAHATQHKAIVIPGLTSAFGVYHVLELLTAGKTACLAPSTEAVLQLINTFEIDCVVGSPQQVLGLSELKDKTPNCEVTSLRTILVCGGAMGRQDGNQVRAALCRNVISLYASTEGGVVAMAPFEFIANIAGAVGFVTPWAEVETVDETGTELPPGTEGLIRYRTPMFVRSMAANKEGAADRQDYWFYPGDIGRITGEGMLCLADRISDVINRGGVKVSSAKVAAVLEGLPEIKEAAVCGIEGKSGLEEVWVAIVPKGDISIAAIKRVLSEHEQTQIDVDEVFFVDEIPRGDLGKVQKVRFKEMLLNLKSRA